MLVVSLFWFDLIIKQAISCSQCSSINHRSQNIFTAHKNKVNLKSPRQRSLYINYKSCEGTNTFKALATLVTRPINPEVCHLLSALIQCNHHQVIILYLKLPFELRNFTSNYSARTHNHLPTRHNLLSSRFPWGPVVFP